MRIGSQSGFTTTGIRETTSENTVQNAIKNIGSSAWIDLSKNAGVHSSLVSDGGWDIQSNKGIYITSMNGAEGIVLDAIPVSNGSVPQVKSGIYLSLIPQKGGTGDFTLSAPHGSVASNSDIGSLPNYTSGNTTYQGVNVTPGIRSYFLNIDAKNTLQTANPYPKYGIVSSRPIQINSDGNSDTSIFNHKLKANNYYFSYPNNPSMPYDAGTQWDSSNKINNKTLYEHLQLIYSLFGKLKTWVDNNYATKNALTTGLNGKANTGHTHNYASSTHTHRTTSETIWAIRQMSVKDGQIVIDVATSLQNIRTGEPG